MWQFPSLLGCATFAYAQLYKEEVRFSPLLPEVGSDLPAAQPLSWPA